MPKKKSKRAPWTTKRVPWTTKHLDLGASGAYMVTPAQGRPVSITAHTVRVLDSGDLHFITDEGHWVLFAQGTWKRVEPKQPLPL